MFERDICDTLKARGAKSSSQSTSTSSGVPIEMLFVRRRVVLIVSSFPEEARFAKFGEEMYSKSICRSTQVCRRSMSIAAETGRFVAIRCVGMVSGFAEVSRCKQAPAMAEHLLRIAPLKPLSRQSRRTWRNFFGAGAHVKRVTSPSTNADRWFSFAQ